MGVRNILGGSSPRGRGTLQRAIVLAAVRRFIPARAGNTSGSSSVPARPPVHPRAGGEHHLEEYAHAREHGSSPRGRGTLVSLQSLLARQRFIPARAGNTLQPPTEPEPRPVHPRAGGEHAWSCNENVVVVGSSPRGRGTLPHDASCPLQRRFIPARAGNTSRGTRMTSP